MNDKEKSSSADGDGGEDRSCAILVYGHARGVEEWGIMKFALICGKSG